MNTFIQVMVNGLGKGAVYALLALGFVIIFKASGVLNFAHGSFVLLGGYVAVRTQDDLGFTVSAILGVATAGLGALFIERVLVARRPLADPIALALLTIGVDVILTEEIIRRLGVELPFLGRPYDGKPIQVGDITFFRTQLIALAVGAVLVTLFFLAFRLTGWGVAMRAQAENREAAALMGIRRGRVTAAAWVIGGVLAGVAVLFLATQDFSGSGLSRGTHAIALVAFPAAIIGGLDSTEGAIVGGAIVGLTEALSAQYISFEFSKVAVYVVMLTVLIVRPSGLFGTRERTRV
ncbi:branched-chain amino acid ABC transporter permease [Sporichthya sp.]|uniref:branched-chain amino acid ABC transporter permease n=1 Tax=Sporichthya sp. TaxID=65475 RepID=UPI0017DEF907|nr:branched-chain amino acid ABC transporter permease [Sporichthya sp.]MBA3742646.1 branched-chain amino acid ABC transporter permease [Sporichthya sp.]